MFIHCQYNALCSMKLEAEMVGKKKELLRYRASFLFCSVSLPFTDGVSAYDSIFPIVKIAAIWWQLISKPSHRQLVGWTGQKRTKLGIMHLVHVFWNYDYKYRTE